MSQSAPERPSVEELEQLFPLTQGAQSKISSARRELSAILHGRHKGLVAILGPCAMTGAITTIDREGEILRQLAMEGTGILTLHRLPPWKPRTNPDDWHGFETRPETVVEAYDIIAGRTEAAANLAIEIGQASHLRRYGPRLTFAWSGGRSCDNVSLINSLVASDPSLPVGIKNGLDGEIDSAMRHVDAINDRRGQENAPAVLIYRGGTNAKNPNDWEKSYRRMLELTNGHAIVDTAHGGEMAHDPAMRFNKSVVGQIACLESVIRIAEKHGELPLGIMIEASDAPSPTDPVMPFNKALDGVHRLNQVRLSL